MILGDLGADVIKVEEPGTGDGVRTIGPFYPDGMSHYFLAINRNKRSIAVDLKRPEGRDLILGLVAQSDVVVENFRPGVMNRLGLSFSELANRKPNIILCSISGFGQTGPMASRPSFDLVSQALSGLMSLTGEPDDPPTKLGLPIGDLAGGLWGAIAILAALQRRTESGPSQHIDLSLLEGVVGLLGYLGQLAMLTGDAPERVGSSHHSVVPYGRFEVKDGYIVLALHVGSFWRRFCQAIERPDLIEDPRFRTTNDRRQNRDVLVPIVEKILSVKTRADWSEILRAADVPFAPILDVAEALALDQLSVRGAIRALQDTSGKAVSVVGPTVRFAGEAEAELRRPPVLGEHSVEICANELGLDLATMQRLIREGILADAGTPLPTRDGSPA
jgi:formyl-CoA transferase/CoA:oxalate CoA-transferase